jgi:competence protein ComGC
LLIKGDYVVFAFLRALIVLIYSPLLSLLIIPSLSSEDSEETSGTWGYLWFIGVVDSLASSYITSFEDSGPRILL